MLILDAVIVKAIKVPVDANSIIEARQKFITENLELLTHGYGSEWDLKFYSCEDTAYPEESENFFEYSLSNNEMHFWGNTIGFFSVPLNKDILSLLEENGIEENEPIEFFDETVKLLYHQVMKQRFHSRQRWLSGISEIFKVSIP